MSKTALILGARSFVAPFLQRRLAAAGWGGWLATRHNPGPLPDSWSWLGGRLAADCPAPVGVTAILTLLPLWLMPDLLPLLPAGAPLIALGSTSAVAKRDSADAAERAVATRLRQAEAAIAGAHERWTVLQPTLIYDGVNDGNVARLRRFIRRWRVLPLPGAAGGLRQPIHADDVAAALVAAAGNAAAHNRVLTITGGETLPYAELCRRIFAAEGLPPRLLHLPAWPLRLAARLATGSGAFIERIDQDLAFDGGEAARLLGLTPRAFTPQTILGGEQGEAQPD